MKELISIQSELKAPKNQFNSFGKYKYRSQEDILEAVKPLLAKYGCVLTIEDEVKQVGNYVFIEARATIKNSQNEQWGVKAQAGVQERKGMDLAQSFGASSSYARKYALNGLFLIDDTKDADATNTHGKDEPDAKNVPTKAEKDILRKLAYTARFDSEQNRNNAFDKIDACDNYDDYARIQHRLEDLQPSIDEIPNPSQTDIKNHVKKLA
jgi:hypothetical protein